MENDETPLWAQELRMFKEFCLTALEARLAEKFAGLAEKIGGIAEKTAGVAEHVTSVEQRLTRKIENIDLRIHSRFDALERDVAELKMRDAR